MYEKDGISLPSSESSAILDSLDGGFKKENMILKKQFSMLQEMIDL